MKNNRGFTLIEIIVSLALLSIISVGMISGLTSQFRFLTGTRDFTEQLSDAQLRMEGEIVDVKKTLEEGGTPSGVTGSYTLFSGTYARTVDGYPRELTVNLGNSTGSFFTVVGSAVLDFPVATATVGLEFQSIDTTLFEYAPSLYASSTVNLVDTEGVNLTNIYRWYVSRPGFNIPMLTLSTPEEVETGTKYPRFPDDYSIIPSSPNSTLASVVSRYPGRHVLCTVTPASTSGKMGATAVSNPLFVSGLPFRTGLALHLDASLISREAPFGEVRTSGSSDYVQNWDDASGEGNDAAQGSTTRQPQLVETFIGDIVDNGFWYESYAKYAAFDGVNDYMTTSVPGWVDTLGTYSTVFVVARDAGAAKFTIYNNTVPAGYVSFGSGYSSSSVTIGNAGSPVDVAEVIVYNAVLTADASEDVMDYLEAKYLPETPEVTIRWLSDVTATVLQNSAYSPPATVSAYMTSGRYQDVPVTWSPSTIDTSTVGDKLSTSTAVADTTKHSTLTVHVVPPTPLTGIGNITVSDNGTNAALSAGALSPTGATATYQWQIYTGGDWENIVGAVSSVYANGVWGQQYRVMATGSGVYTGTVVSNPLTLNVTPLTAIGTPLITGGGSYAELTSGEPTPAAATVSYQWQSNSSGSWQDVAGATSKVYSYATWGVSYRVKATGIGAYSGTVYSGSVTPTRVTLQSIDNIAIYWDGAHFMLTAGAVAPSGATVTYQWQYYSSGWKNVTTGGTSSTLTATAGTRYRVQATGTGMYYGTVTSAEITAEEIDLESISIPLITWNEDGSVLLTAGVVDPAGATVTYQWQYYSSRWRNISGATSATYTGSEETYYRVQAIGTGMYNGTVNSDYVYPTKTSLRSIGAITVTWDGDSPLLTVGALDPAGATATYQWQYRSGGNWYYTGATGATYTATMGTQYRVVATGSGGYTGTVTSASVTPNKTPLTGIGNITVSWSGSSPVLTAGAVNPSGATFTYQWWSNGSIISGATSSSYTGTAGTSYYVTATGTGLYTGTVTSSTVTPTRTSLQSIGNITVSWSGSSPVLTAGAVNPSGATFTYQWWSNGSIISGATSSSYTGTAGTSYYVTATGTGAYIGTVTSSTIAPRRTSLTGIGNITINWISSTPILTAGAVTPPGATFTYQWQTYDGGWSNIAGATSASYTGTVDKRYRVTATGTGAYADTVASLEVTTTRDGLDSIGAITVTWNSGTPTLAAGSVLPAGATYTLQWQSYSGGWNNITGATSATYTGTSGTQYRVAAIGTGGYTGTKYSSSVTPTAIQVTNIGAITRSGSTLYPGTITPSGATVTYQWQRRSQGWFSGWSDWSTIDTDSTCSYTADSWFTDYQYRLIVTGSGQYYGSATSATYDS